MCGQSTAYNIYATLAHTNPLFMGFSGYLNVNKEIIILIEILKKLRLSGLLFLCLFDCVKMLNIL